MNTILTDDEIGAIQTQVLADFRRHVQEEGRGTASPASIARAVEAAVLAKLAQQEPIGYLPSYEADSLKSGHDARLRSAKFGPSQLDGDVPLYTHPAPQQADRQRVPADLKERCTEILHWKKTALLKGEALRNFADRRFPGEVFSIQMAEAETANEAFRYIAAAPEAPAQADDLNINPVTLGRTPWAYGEAPANTRNSGDLAASAVDERAEFEAWYETAACIGIEPAWAAWQARAALAQKAQA